MHTEYKSGRGVTHPLSKTLSKHSTGLILSLALLLSGCIGQPLLPGVPPAGTPAPTATPQGGVIAPTDVPPTASQPPPTAGATATLPAVSSGLPPAPTYAPEPSWPTSAPPTPFPAPHTLPVAAGLPLPPTRADSAWAAALRPAFAADAASDPSRSIYQMTLRLNPAGSELLGHERITFTNKGSAPVPQVVLRLYPNFPGIFDERQTPTGFGRLQVGTAQAGDTAAEMGYLAGNTAVSIHLPQPLAPGARTSITLDFRLSLNGLGPAPDVWYFKSFYPMLAVQEGDHWRLDVTAFPDQVFAESSLYEVDFAAPPGVVLASSGTETGTQPGSDVLGDQVVHHILAGPVREFAASASTRYTQETRQQDDITIRATMLMTDTAQAEEDLGYAVEAVRVYNDLFGAYPFNELDMLLTSDGGGGIEFPGYVMISHLRDVAYLRQHVVSHEVAHQWWFSLVGDDIYREAWLDESFADYSTYLYLQQTAGQQVAEQVFQQQTAGGWPDYPGRVDIANPHEGKRVGAAIWEFKDFGEYDGIIYGKGPVFLERLRRTMGDDAFFRLLQTHFARNKYGITTGRTFLAEAESVAGANAPAVRTLYLAWIEGR